MQLETFHVKCKDKRKNILHQAPIPPCPTFREGESKCADEESIPRHSGHCRFQLTDSSVPSSVSVTGSTDSYWEPATSINPQPNSLPAIWDGKAGFLYPPTLSYQNRNTVDKDKKVACAKVCRSITAWEDEVKSYVNNNKEKMNALMLWIAADAEREACCVHRNPSCLLRACPHSSGKSSHRAIGHFY